VFDANTQIGLVADVGGTNTRLALAGRDSGGEIVTAFRQDLRNDDHASLEACVAAYLAALGAAPVPTMAAFGVASPVSGDLVRLTNRDWTFSIAAFAQRFGWTRFEVVNDFAALGHAVPALTRSQWRPLAGPPWPDVLPPVVSLVGPGTGFGVGTVLQGEGRFQVIASEGGHASFAPLDMLDVRLLEVMLRRFPRVSNERILSGPGLENLYAAVAEVESRSPAPLSAPQIVEAALSGRDGLARAAVTRFGLILGSAIGDVALVQGAGAVAIGGGIAPRIVEFIDNAQVRARFEAKGRAARVLADVPIALIAHPEPGLLGAARLLFA
jgi:glucokinase